MSIIDWTILLLTQNQNQKFAERLALAIESKGLRQSPTLIAKFFNSKYKGRLITAHTARNWLLGKSFPTQEKLVCLAEILNTSPEQLRFGRAQEKTLIADFGNGEFDVSNEDQQFIKQYLKFNKVQRLLFRELAGEFNGKAPDELTID
jgi:transcriptional regulator with XRE-family HTH domain